MTLMKKVSVFVFIFILVLRCRGDSFVSVSRCGGKGSGHGGGRGSGGGGVRGSGGGREECGRHGF